MKNIILFIALSIPLFGAEARVVWDENPEPDVVSYTLYYQRDGDQQKQITTEQTSVALDLEPGEWTFYVKATNDEGTDSIPSDSIRHLIKKNPPSQPKGIKVTSNIIRIEGSDDKKKWSLIATIVNYKKFIRIN